MRQIELGCDAIAAATLVALGDDPTELEKLLRVIVNYSPDVQRHNDGTAEYPSLTSRIDTIQAVKESLVKVWNATRATGEMKKGSTAAAANFSPAKPPARLIKTLPRSLPGLVPDRLPAGAGSLLLTDVRRIPSTTLE